MPRKNQKKEDLTPLVDGFRISDKKAPDYIKKAYKSWADQRQRCSNPQDPRYKWWGAKGIKVQYTSYDFVLWWAKQWKEKGPFVRANCSRIDHTKDYTLDNIFLGECSENAKERMDRLGPPKEGTPVTAVQLTTGNVFHFKSVSDASNQTGVASSNVLHMIKNGPQRTIRVGWVFLKTMV